MKRKVLVITCIVAVVLVIVVAVILSNNSSKFQYNAPTATGNTAGNLNNGGKFAEYNGKIYFSNPYDHGTLYVMNSDCTEPKKLNDDSPNYINVCGSYMYYAKNNYSKENVNSGNRARMYGVYRTSLSGKDAQNLYETLSGICSLYGNSLYYQRYDDKIPLCFYSIGIDKTNETKLSTTAINPASINNGRVYYADPDHKNNIYAYDIDSKSSSLVADANAYMVDAAGLYIYYIDIAKNYSLVRYNTGNNTTELLYEPENGRVLSFNRYGNKIFFSVEGENFGLYRINIDGTQSEFITKGNMTNIQCTSKYTFFQYYDNKETLYRVPTIGSITKIEEIVIQKED